MRPEQFEALQSDTHYMAELERIRSTYPPDEEGYVRLEEVSANELNSTAQYTGRYIHGHENKIPALGEDLDVDGSVDNFAAMRIKLEDVPVLLERIAAHKKTEMARILGKSSN